MSAADLTFHDNLHFDGRSLQELGARYASAYFEATSALKMVPVEVSPDQVQIAGRVVYLRDNAVSVSAGASVVVSLPVQMADAYYVPNVQLLAHGSSTPYPPLITARTVTGFTIKNPGAQNMTVSWDVQGLIA